MSNTEYLRSLYAAMGGLLTDLDANGSAEMAANSLRYHLKEHGLRIRSDLAAPRAEGLDVELAAIYLAAAMKECGYTATEADARSILDYLDGDNGVRLAPQERRDKEGTADTRTTENPDPLLRLPCNCDNDGWYVHDPDCLRGIAWEARAEARESAVSAVVKGMTDLRREAEAAQGTAPRAEEMTAVELTPDNTIIVNGTTLPAWVAATIARRAAPRAEGPLRAALERLLDVAMTEEEDVSPATQDEWIAAIKQANEALE